MKKVAYLISHGHTARGALQTGLLERLSEFCEVHVIAKHGTTDILVKSIKGTGIHVHGFKYKISRWDQQKSMLRMHVHQNIRQNPALWEKHLRRSQDKRTSRQRRWANQLYYYLGAILRLTPRGKYIFSNWESKVNLKANATELLNTIKPDFLISTRPVDEMEIYLLEAAKILPIHRVFYILSWDNITSKGVFPVLADTYLTWGAIMNQELNEYWIQKDIEKEN